MANGFTSAANLTPEQRRQLGQQLIPPQGRAPSPLQLTGFTGSGQSEIAPQLFGSGGGGGAAGGGGTSSGAGALGSLLSLGGSAVRAFPGAGTAISEALGGLFGGGAAASELAAANAALAGSGAAGFAAGTGATQAVTSGFGGLSFGGGATATPGFSSFFGPAAGIGAVLATPSIARALFGSGRPSNDQILSSFVEGNFLEDPAELVEHVFPEGGTVFNLDSGGERPPQTRAFLESFARDRVTPAQRAVIDAALPELRRREEVQRRLRDIAFADRRGP